MSRNLQFKKGELVEVLGNYRIYGVGSFAAGPHGHEWWPILAKDLTPGDVFLVLEDVKKASWRQNRRLYTQIMTPSGPKTVWASVFKMRKKE